MKRKYNVEIQKLCKKYKVVRLPDYVAAATKFEVRDISFTQRKQRGNYLTFRQVKYHET